MSTSVVLVGNPGAGKSFILNTLLNRRAVRSGVSIGSTLTQETVSICENGSIYFDTPGLYDLERTEYSAQQISSALSHGGTYRLVFVVTLEDGRARSHDLTTVQVVLNAIEQVGIQMSGRYAVIVNKCSPAEMAKLRVSSNRDNLQFSFSTRKFLRAENLGFFPSLAEAEGQNNVLITRECGYKDFINRAPTVVLPVDKKIIVDVRDFEKVTEDMERERRTLVSKLEELRRRQGKPKAGDLKGLVESLFGKGVLDDMSNREAYEKGERMGRFIGSELVQLVEKLTRRGEEMNDDEAV